MKSIDDKLVINYCVFDSETDSVFNESEIGN